MRINSSTSPTYLENRIAALKDAPLKEGSLPADQQNMPV